MLQVVYDYAHGRPVIFSTFQPDAALLARKLQSIYPVSNSCTCPVAELFICLGQEGRVLDGRGNLQVFFLTNGGTELYYDARRNSLEEATKLCLEGGLQGIVSEVKAVFRNPGAVSKIKESRLSLLTYGKLK